MDIRIKCPVCGLEMDLPQNMTAFSCPECGAQLYYLKGNVITKEQARTLLRKLIEKKQAEKENEQRIARISVRTVEKTVEAQKAPAEVKTEAPTPGIPYVGPAKIQPSEEPKTENKTENKDKTCEKRENHTVKSGVGFAIFLYVFTAAFMFVWHCYLGNFTLSATVAAYGEKVTGFIDYVWAYLGLLVFLAWVCASSSFMSLGVVRGRIDFRAEAIASACTVLNIPNLPLMAVLNVNRKKIRKYRRSVKGARYDFGRDYIVATSVIEALTLCACGYLAFTAVYALINGGFAAVGGSPLYVRIITVIYDVYIPAMILFISLSRLVKLMAKGKKMKMHKA